MPFSKKLTSGVRNSFLNFFRYLSRSVVSLRRNTFGRIHLHLLSRVLWYSKWHRHPQHRKVHYSALALTCLLVCSSIVTTLFPNPSGVEAAVATWDFTHDNTKYDYDSSKISMAGGNAFLTNPGSATGASTNINAASGTTTNTSAQFASANKEYLTIPSNSSLQTGDIDFEIGGWVRLDSVGDSSNIFQQWKSYPASRSYQVRYDVNLHRFTFGVSSTGSGSVAVTANNLGVVSNNTWYYIRAWHNATENTINIHINNGTVDTVSHSAGVYVSSADITLGVSGDKSYFLNGRLDSWYFQKRISTTNEATSLYNAGSGRTYSDLTSANGLDTFKTGLTSWWDFNEEGGTRYDSKGTNHLTSAADPIIAPPVYGGELIVNSGFETVSGSNFGTWEEVPGDGVVEDETISVHSGTHAVKLTNGASNNLWIYNTFAVTAGLSYYYSFWSRGDGVNVGRYGFYDLSNSSYFVTKAPSNNPTTTYQLFTGQFTAPAGCSSARIYLFAPAVGTAYFDDILLKQITTAAVNNGGFDLKPATGGEKTNISTTSFARNASNIATIVTAGAHGLKTGDVVTITGIADSTINGVSKTVTVVNNIAFTYSSTGSMINSTSDSGGRITTDVFNSWIESNVATTTTNAETDTPYSGAYTARLDIDGAGSLSQLTQNVLIVGKTYNTTVYAKTNVAGSTMYIGDGFASNSFIPTLTTSYAAYSGSFVAAHTSFVIQKNSATSRSLFIDQVTLTSQGPTAEAGIAASSAVDGNFGAGFNGSSQYLSRAYATAADLDLGTSNATLFGSFYINNWYGTQAQTIINKGATSGSGISAEGYWLRINTSGGVEFFVGDSSNNRLMFASANSLVTPGNWYNIAVSLNRASVATIYLNGVSIGTLDISSIQLSLNSPADFQLGLLGAGYLSGREDGVGIIKRVLTGGEIVTLHNNGKGLKYAQLPDSIKNDSALKGYWDLDEKTGTRYDSTSNHNDLTDNGTVTQVQGVNYYEGTIGTIFDASGNSNTFNQATITKRPTYSQSGINNKPTMLFDGVDDSLVATGDKIGTGDVTVTAMVRLRGYGVTSGRIIDNSKYVFRIDPASSGMVGVGSDGATSVYSSSSSIALNTSYIITVTRTMAGIVNIYINGVLSGAANQNSGTPTVGSDTYLGNRAAVDRAFDGSIGTVQIYNSILDPLHRNNLEKSLGEKYGITVATDAAALSSSASSSLYPTLSLNNPLRFSSLSSVTPTPASSSTGTLRYQLTNNSTEGAGAGNSSSYYYHNGTNWVSANKYNAYQSNTAAEIATNLAAFTSTILPTHNLKWRAFFVTDGVDSPALSSINANFISDTEPPPPAVLETAKDSASTNIPLATNNWYNYGAPSFTWQEPVDASTIEYEQPSGIAGYLTYFGTDNTVNIGLTNGTVQTGINNAAFTWQTSRTYTVNQTLESGQTYYLKVIPVDSAGNAAHSADSTTYNLFTYKYDSELPTPLEYVQVAQVGCSTSPTFDLTWPASTDSLSGLKYYQYKVGVNGTVNTTTNTTVSVAPERENENVFYVRPVDNANNSNPTQNNTIWQSTVFCSTQSVTLTSGPTYTKTLSTLTVDFETSRPTTSKVEVYKTNQDNTLEKVSTGEDTTLSLTHSVQVPNLTPDTPYKYKLFFKDQNNNEGESNYYEASTDLISLSHTTTNNLENSLSSLTIIFETTKPAKARVEVYKDTNKQQEVSTQDYTLNHHLTINNLTSGTTYTYKIFYIDQENNNYESSTYTTTTTTVGIVDLPTITSGPNSVNIIWKTNLPTTGQVQIKEGDTYKEPQGHITYLTDHNVTIQGLKSEKPYKLRIIWTDQSNKTDQTGWFEANTASAPMIKNLTAEVLSPDSVLTSWETNYSAICSIYSGVGDTSKKDAVDGVATVFSKRLTGLTSGSLYQIKAGCSTTEEVEFVAAVTAQTPPLPSITNFTFEPNLTGSTPAYKFTWLTNTETSTVVYYKVKGTGEYKSSSNPDLLKEHLVLIKDFEDQAIYEVYAAGTDKYGNVAKSDLNTITTPNDSRPPKITNLSTSVKSSGFADNQKAQVIVTWDTDELTTSQVEYANGIEGTEYQNRTKEETALSTSHVVVISDLEPSKIYHLRAISKDQANNPAYSQDTTVITGKVQKSVLDIILASLQKSLGWITKLFN